MRKTIYTVSQEKLNYFSLSRKQLFFTFFLITPPAQPGSDERQLSHKQKKFLLAAAKSQASKCKQLNYKAVFAAQALKIYPSKYAEENILLFHNYQEF